MRSFVHEQPPPVLKLLAHELRWQMLQWLAVGDYRVNELVELVGQPMNLVSYHLKLLRQDHVVDTRRSEADGRDVYYRLDVDRLDSMYREAGMALHPSLGNSSEAVDPVSERRRVLILCTHNSARSQMAEAWLRHLSRGAIEVHSAGSHPSHVHPDAIKTMADFGIDIGGQQAKHFNEFEGQSFDFVITVCDKAREVCPTFPVEQGELHWGYADPTLIEDAVDRAVTFLEMANSMKSRIQHFLARLAHD
jgi:protein-tyrosine-phosphatase